jgi:thiamine kinase-like enzyme
LVKKRIPHLRETLQADSLLTGKSHSDAFEAIDICEKNFLFEGYEEHFRAMIPREYGSVISHNDGQECNLLLSDKDNTKMIIIDYEYCGWNPPAYDIANYMNEMTFDNNPRFGKGCQYYQVNFPSDSAER